MPAGPAPTTAASQASTALQPSILSLIPNLNASQLRRHRNAGAPALAIGGNPLTAHHRARGAQCFRTVSKVPHRKAVLPICETKKHGDIANHDQNEYG